MASDLICPNVQNKKYLVHGSWIKFKDQFPDLDWSKAVEYSEEGKEKVVEKGRKVRVVEKGNLQKGTFLEILTMGGFRRIQFRYKTEKSNLDLSLQSARDYLVINHIVFLRSLRKARLLSP